jgi:uncharacterized membrane protein YdjX (TVP38/TMEM64 family)
MMEIMQRIPWGRILPLLVIAAAIALVFYFRLDRYLTLDQLAANREWLKGEVARLGVAAALLFVVVYAAAVALSVPGAIILTLSGGFLFGPFWGALLTVIGATVGATIIFLIAKTALGDALRAKAGGAVKRLEEGFRKDAFSYLLVLRLVPLFPFWLVNLVPAFLGVKLRTFVAATFLGIIPGTAVYAGVGNGLGAVIDKGEKPNLGIILEPQVLLPLIGLALLALIPVAYKRFKRGGAAEGPA